MSLALPLPGEVHVRRVEWDDKSVLFDYLSEEERERAGRFCFERDAQRWAAGRSFLRRTLGSYLNTAPGKLQFETGAWGKPGLRDCPLRFNVSHSGDAVLLAFAWRQEIGVDIERCRLDFSPAELASAVFSARELAWLRDFSPEECHQAFFTLWTAKEAYVKARGEGLSFPLDQLSLIPISETDCFQVQDLTLDGTRPRISVCRLNWKDDLETGYFAALALTDHLNCVHYFE